MSIVLRFDVNGTTYFSNTFENTSIQITKRVSSLESLSSQSIITKETFRVPLEGDLATMLGYISDINQDANININKKIAGQIIVNDLPRFFGSFQVLNIYQLPKNNTSEVELIFKGSETDLKQVLTDVSMSSLYEGETIPYTAANIASWLASPTTFTDTNGYFYPLVDYGQNFVTDPAAIVGTNLSTTPISQLDLKPAVTIKDCFDRMPIDITYDSDIEDLIEGQGILLHNNERSVSRLDTSPRDYTGYLYRSSDGTIVNPTGETKIPFNAEYNYNQDNIDLVNDRYVAPVSGFYTFKVQGQIDLNASVPLAGVIKFYIYFAVDGISSLTAYSAGGIQVNVGSPNRTIDVNYTFSYYLSATQTAELKVIYSDTNVTSLNVVTKSGFRFEIVSSPEVTSSSNLLMDRNCPDLTAWDIFSNVVKQCKGIIEISSDGVYNIIAWNDWIDSNTNVLYLDEYVDPTKNIKIAPFSTMGAKAIKLSYEENEDNLSQKFKKSQGNIYGTLKIDDTGTDFTTKEVKIESKFTNPAIATIAGSSFLVPKLYDESGATINSKSVLVQFGGTFYNRSLAFSLKDAVVGVGTTTYYNDYPYCGHWSFDGTTVGGFTGKDYNFGQSLTFFSAEGYPNNTLYERFWKRYIQETYSEYSREITLSVGLNIEQVDALELNEIVLFKGSKCRIVEISNVSLKNGETFPIKLMKRIDIENIDIAPFYPYDVIDGIVQWKDSIDNSDLGDGNSSDQTDLEASALAYGFAYDANLDIVVQRGQILQL